MMNRIKNLLSTRRKSIVAAGLVAALVIVVAYGFTREPRYTAVFLSNDQVYFGKLTRVRSAYPVLRDVYYLQVTQSNPQSLQQAAGIAAGSQKLQLIKLGSELHGPSDEMILNRDHILFAEPLKKDSQVVGAIKEYQAIRN